ncbi:MAG: hypothetical protein MHM6MM_002463 [Cercozoa sp. M6MM]
MSHEQYYDDWWTEEDALAAVERGTAIRGKLRINAKNPLKASFVGHSDPRYNRDVYLADLKARNRACHHDEVIVSISQWLESPVGQQPRGQVVYIAKRHRFAEEGLGRMFGRIESFTNDATLTTSNYARFRPLLQTAPQAVVPVRQLPKEYATDPNSDKNKFLVAEVQYCDWTPESRWPKANFVRMAGNVGDIDTETDILLAMHQIDWTETFPPEVVDQVNAYSERWEIPAEEFENRCDLRDMSIFTIDPPTARDLDDALSIRRISGTRVELGVHIADLTYFMPLQSPLDKEAAKRATTVYLVQKNIPMVPRVLCDLLCSLHPHVDRLAVSMFVTCDLKTGEVVGEPWFGRSIIRSRVKLDYETAQKLIDDTEMTQEERSKFERKENDETATFAVDWPQIANACKLMHRLAVVLRRNRFQGGALALDNAEIKFKLNDEGLPCEVTDYPIFESNHLVEECMLLANMCVAKRLKAKLPQRALLRRHQPPNPLGIRKMQDLLKMINLNVDFGSAKALSNSLHKLENLPALSGHVRVRSLVEFLLTTPMQQAEYVCFGATNAEGEEMDESSVRHYALNTPLYTHFTSPIRRYADVLVHRSLLYTVSDQSENVDEVVASPQRMQAQADNCNYRKMNADAAQIQSNEVFLLSLLSARPLRQFGVLTDIGPKSCTIALPDFALLKRVKFDDLARWTREGDVPPLDYAQVLYDGEPSSMNAGSHSTSASSYSTRSKKQDKRGRDKGRSKKSKPTPAEAHANAKEEKEVRKQLQLVFVDGTERRVDIMGWPQVSAFCAVLC